MGAPLWVTTVFVPSLALIVNNVMWSSPLQAFIAARKSRDLGTLNPVPSVLTVLNCVGWIIYGLMKKDVFVFFANVPGLLIGLFSTVTSMTILAGRTKPNETLCDEYLLLEKLVLFAFFFWSIMALISQFSFTSFPDSENQAQLFIGYVASCFAICYYAAPLSTLAKIIKSKDASSMYPPMIAANFANAFLWTVYGFAINDINVYGPNVLGVLLSCFQAGVLFMYYKKPNSGSNNIVDHGEGGDNKESHKSSDRHFSAYLGQQEMSTIEGADVSSPLHNNDEQQQKHDFDRGNEEDTTMKNNSIGGRRDGYSLNKNKAEDNEDGEDDDGFGV